MVVFQDFRLFTAIPVSNETAPGAAAQDQAEGCGRRGVCLSEYMSVSGHQKKVRKKLDKN